MDRTEDTKTDTYKVAASRTCVRPPALNNPRNKQPVNKRYFPTKECVKLDCEIKNKD